MEDFDNPGAEQLPDVPSDPVAPAAPGPDPAIARLEAQIQEQQERFDRLRASVNNQPMPMAPSGPGPSKSDLEKQFWADPLGSSAAIASQVAQQVAQQVQSQSSSGNDTLAEVARQQARASNPELFDQYYPEILQLINQLPASAKLNTTIWQNSRDVVFGRHMSDIMATRPAAPARTSDGLAAPSTRPAPAPAKPKLSEDESNVARKLGLTTDQYLAGKEAYANQDSKWPLTFDRAASGRRGSPTPAK